MARYHVTTHDDGTVHLRTTDQSVMEALGVFFSPHLSRVYSVRREGGYVRDNLNRQVCERLSDRGVTLRANPQSLSTVIRRELQRALRAHAKETR